MELPQELVGSNAKIAIIIDRDYCDLWALGLGIIFAYKGTSISTTIVVGFSDPSI